MMKYLIGALGAVTAMTTVSAATPQRPALDRAMLPYALQYAACVHQPDASCGRLRETLIARAEPVLRHYQPNAMLQVQPRFVRLLDGIDQGAADLRQSGEAPSPQLVSYMQCLGDAFVADDRFEAGVAVDQNRALDRCEGARAAIPVANLTTDEQRRSRRYLFNVEALLTASNGVLIRDGLLGLPTYPNYG